MTAYNGKCPLGKIIREPITDCFYCLFSRFYESRTDLSKICKAPEGMTKAEYERLKTTYQKTHPRASEIPKPDFLDFVETQRAQTRQS